jgi:hypothetical protein
MSQRYDSHRRDDPTDKLLSLVGVMLTRVRVLEKRLDATQTMIEQHLARAHCMWEALLTRLENIGASLERIETHLNSAQGTLR